jgi:TP53 regulating kinase-like protein
MGEANMTRALIKKGAEASLYVDSWHERHVVIKTRLPKKYRPEQLDLTIRRYRTVHEPQLMHEAKRAGVPTPTIFLVDVKEATIIMEYIEGKQVKQILDSVPEKQRREICTKSGSLIGKLHEQGLIHGDLTTSNMILTAQGRIFMLDFGLGDKNGELEAQGVDLHLLKRALQSTHFQIAEQCFKAVLEGYASVRGSDATASVLDKISEIEKRGRYVAERQQEDIR